jgi:hypothetical protein
VTIYYFGVIGAASESVVDRLTLTVREHLQHLGLANHLQVIGPGAEFVPPKDYASVAVFFGSPSPVTDDDSLKRLMRGGTPVLPVVQDLRQYNGLVPTSLRAINGLELDAADPAMNRVATAALEILKLIPRQRRLFLSYRRTESRSAAVQLFEHLSSRHFDVFLDTHGIAPGADFQETLWHRLSDSDALVMLDTTTYFERRWTTQEFGRALAKSLVPVRIGWPGVKPNGRSLATESVQLTSADFAPNEQVLTDEALQTVTLAIEKARSRGIAVRSAELNGAVIAAVEKVDGQFLALGPKRTIIVQLHSGHKVLIYPSVGVPTAEHLHEAALLETIGDSRAVVYDDAGVAPAWQEHLTWLGTEIRSAKWLKKGHAAWELGAWGDEVNTNA